MAASMTAAKPRCQQKKVVTKRVHRVVPAPGAVWRRCIYPGQLDAAASCWAPAPSRSWAPRVRLVRTQTSMMSTKPTRKAGSMNRACTRLSGCSCSQCGLSSAAPALEGQCLRRSLQLHVLPRLAHLAHDVHRLRWGGRTRTWWRAARCPGTQAAARVTQSTHHHRFCSRWVEELRQDDDQGEDHLHHCFHRNQLPPPVPSLVSRGQGVWATSVPVAEPRTPAQSSRGATMRNSSAATQGVPEGPHGPWLCGRATGWRWAATSRELLGSKSVLLNDGRFSWSGRTCASAGEGAEASESLPGGSGSFGGVMVSVPCALTLFLT